MLLLLIILLYGVSITAIVKGHAFVSFLGFAFGSIVIFIIYKQMRSRWCIECQLPMQALPKKNTEYERLYYVCGLCGKVNDTGIQLSWPE